MSIDALDMLHRGIFNPFQGFFESTSHPHARTLRTNLTTKFTDMFSVLFGIMNIVEWIQLGNAYKTARDANDQAQIRSVREKLYIVVQKSKLGLIDLFVLLPFILAVVLLVGVGLLFERMIKGCSLLRLSRNRPLRYLGNILSAIVIPFVIVSSICLAIGAIVILCSYLFAKLIVSCVVSAAFSIIPIVVHAISRLAGYKARNNMKELQIETVVDANNVDLLEVDRQEHQKKNVAKLLKYPEKYDRCQLRMPDPQGATSLEREGYLAIFEKETNHNNTPDMVVKFNALINKKDATIALFKLNMFNIAYENDNPVSHRVKIDSENALRSNGNNLHDPLLRKRYDLDSKKVYRPHYISTILKQNGIHHDDSSKKESTRLPGAQAR